MHVRSVLFHGTCHLEGPHFHGKHFRRTAARHGEGRQAAGAEKGRIRDREY